MRGKHSLTRLTEIANRGAGKKGKENHKEVKMRLGNLGTEFQAQEWADGLGIKMAT